MSQKTCDFSSIFVRCSSFLHSSISQKCVFSLRKITIFKVFAKIAFLLSLCIFGQKNLPKTLSKQGSNPSKIDAKNVLVFDIDFFASWPRFWSLLGLQVGAMLAQVGSQLSLKLRFWHPHRSEEMFWRFLQSKIWIYLLSWRPPGSILEALQPWFWRVLARILWLKFNISSRYVAVLR